MTPADRAERKAHRDEITAASEAIKERVAYMEFERPKTLEVIHTALETIATEADALK